MTGVIRRYVLASGFAASEVGALMAALAVFALASGAKSWIILVEILLLAALGVWLWRRKSLVAAVLMLVLVIFEYANIVASYPNNSWVQSYPILFLAALIAHGRKPREWSRKDKHDALVGACILAGVVAVIWIVSRIFF